jgi:hypothetical protein
MPHNEFPVQGLPEDDPIIDRRDAPETLFERHHQYKRYNQTERPTNELYIKEGHPNAAEYQTLRDFFEHLQWAANSEARFYSYDSPTEQTQYWAPQLHVTDNADLVPPGEWDDHVSLIEFVDLTADNTRFSPGSWIIKTENEYFFEAVRTAIESFDKTLSAVTVTPEYHTQHYNWGQDDYFSGRWYLDSIKEFNRAISIIDDFVDPLVDIAVDTNTETATQ